jgi:hypothetical protein
MTDEKIKSDKALSGEPKKYSPPTGLRKRSFANGWELTVTTGFRRGLSKEIAIRENIKKSSRRKSDSSAPKGTMMSTNLDQNLLLSFATFMASGFGFTKDTEEKAWEMCTPLVQSLLETHALLEQEGILATDTSKPLEGEDS